MHSKHGFRSNNTIDIILFSDSTSTCFCFVLFLSEQDVIREQPSLDHPCQLIYSFSKAQIIFVLRCTISMYLLIIIINCSRVKLERQASYHEKYGHDDIL
jgi:hypothetical protein